MRTIQSRMGESTKQVEKKEQEKEPEKKEEKKTADQTPSKKAKSIVCVTPYNEEKEILIAYKDLSFERFSAASTSQPLEQYASLFNAQAELYYVLPLSQEEILLVVNQHYFIWDIKRNTQRQVYEADASDNFAHFTATTDRKKIISWAPNSPFTPLLYELGGDLDHMPSFYPLMAEKKEGDRLLVRIIGWKIDSLTALDRNTFFVTIGPLITSFKIKETKHSSNISGVYEIRNHLERKQRWTVINSSVFSVLFLTKMTDQLLLAMLEQTFLEKKIIQKNIVLLNKQLQFVELFNLPLWDQDPLSMCVIKENNKKYIACQYAHFILIYDLHTHYLVKKIETTLSLLSVGNRAFFLHSGKLNRIQNIETSPFKKVFPIPGEFIGQDAAGNVVVLSKEKIACEERGTIVAATRYKESLIWAINTTKEEATCIIKKEKKEDSISCSGKITALAICYHYLLIGLQEKNKEQIKNVIYVFNMNRYQRHMTLSTHNLTPTTCIAPFFKECHQFVSGHQNGMVLAWDFTNEKKPEIMLFKNPCRQTPPVTALSVSPYGDVIVAAYRGRVEDYFIAWDAIQKKPLATYHSHSSISSLLWLATDSYDSIVLGLFNGLIILLTLQQGHLQVRGQILADSTVIALNKLPGNGFAAASHQGITRFEVNFFERSSMGRRSPMNKEESKEPQVELTIRKTH